MGVFSMFARHRIGGSARGALLLLLASAPLSCTDDDPCTSPCTSRPDGGVDDGAVSEVGDGSLVDGGSAPPDATTARDAEADVSNTSASPLEVTTKAGRVQGKLLGGTNVFLGIPYGKAPVGPLRFMPSQPAEAWSGTKLTTDYGPSCLQNPGALGAQGAQSEDCLSLNVFAPSHPSGKLPVMVWIHGGAFISGGSNQYDSARLSSEGQQLIVTLNYRLGTLGFLSHPALDQRRGNAPSGNDGLRDQQLALAWVQDNIAAFGGDPDNVTIFGESAGSVSACLQMVSPTAQTFAKRYIMQSGACVGGLPILPKPQADAMGGQLTEALCAGEADTVACLQAKPVMELVSWGASRSAFGAGWAPVMNASDPLLPKRPIELLAAKSNKSPIILGTNKNEYGLFLALGRAAVNSLETMNAAIDVQYPQNWRERLRAHYAATDATANETFVRMLSDSMFRCPTRTLARAAAAAGMPVYLYSFEEGSAWHAIDVAYLFGRPLAALGVTTVDPLHGVIQSYWSQFARSGDPSVSHLPVWPRYEAASDRHMTLISQPVVADMLAKVDCDFWDQLLATP